MSKLGEFFKLKREKQGISIQEVSMSLKISTKVLNALESGDKANLPARTFIRGFVKSYAVFLQLDPQEALHLFNEEYGLPPPPDINQKDGKQNSESSPEQQKDSTDAPTSPAAPKPVVAETPSPTKMLPPPPESRLDNKFILGFLFVILIAVIAGIIKVVTKYQNERVLNPDIQVSLEESATPDQSEAPPSAIDPILNLSSGEPSVAAGSGSPTEPITVGAAATATPSPTTSLAASNTPTPTPTATPTPTPSPSLGSSSSPSLSPSPSATPTQAQSPVEVIVEATDAVDLKYVVGTSTAKSLSMSAGELITIRSKSVLTLEISDGAKATLIINGIVRGKAPEGKPLKLNFPE